MIMVKVLFASLWHKKGRALLLLFSIAVCGALLFTSACFRTTAAGMVRSAGRRWGGQSHLIIETRSVAGATEWLPEALPKGHEGDFEYVYQMLRGKALVAPDTDNMRYFTIIGADLEEFHRHNPILLREGSLENFEGSKVILSAAYADQLGLAIGDTMAVELEGKLYGLAVAGISEASGLFLRDVADGGYLLVPKELLQQAMNGEINLAFLRLREPGNITAIREGLQQEMPDYLVNLAYDDSVINAEINNYVMPFSISIVLVLFMSAFIIYTSFGLIVTERIPLLGILRSQGCSRAKTTIYLLLESVVIGAVGGLLGCFGGTGILQLLQDTYFSGDAAVGEIAVRFGLGQIAFALFCSCLITLASSLIPILRVTGRPVKELILGDFHAKRTRNSKQWIPGLLLLILCAAAPAALGYGFVDMVLAVVVVLLVLVAINLCIPAICRLAAWLLHRLPLPYAVRLGVKNAGDFQGLCGNVRLFASVVAIMIFMLTLTNSMAVDLREGYARERYDLTLTLRRTGDEELAKLTETDAVKNCIGVYEAYGSITSHGSFLNALYGVEDPASFFDYSSASIPPGTDINTIMEGRSIVTTNILREKLGLSLGDTLTLQMEGRTMAYTITGFLDSNWGIGHVGYVSADNFRADFGTDTYSKILLRSSGTAEEAKQAILRAFSRDVLSITTKAEIEAANADKVEGIFQSITAYAGFATLIGLVGILNNIAACFLDRKRSLALYRCVGLDRRGMQEMLAAEAITIGVLGVLTGLTAGLCMMQAVPNAVAVLWGLVKVNTPTDKVLLLCAGGLVLMVFASLIPAIKSRGLSIMETLRYE